MQARYQHPVTGRFLSVDPVEFLADGRTGMVNRYSYSGNDPINNVDPDGMPFFDFGAKEKVSQYNGDPGDSTSMTESGPASSTLNPSGAMNSVNGALGAGGMAVAEGYSNTAFETADMASNEVLSSAISGDAVGVGIGIASAGLPVRAKGKNHAVKNRCRRSDRVSRRCLSSQEKRQQSVYRYERRWNKKIPLRHRRTRR